MSSHIEAKYIDWLRRYDELRDSAYAHLSKSATIETHMFLKKLMDRLREALINRDQDVAKQCASALSVALLHYVEHTQTPEFNRLSDLLDEIDPAEPWLAKLIEEGKGERKKTD